MSDIVQKLATWKGRQYLEAMFESHGFTAHKVYQNLVSNECKGIGINVDISIEEFWDESAREFVCSAGKIKPDQRTFDVPHAYRSFLLDKLMEYPESPLAANFKVPRQVKSIHPCLDFFKKKRFSDKAFALGFSSAVKKAIDVEMGNLPTSVLNKAWFDVSVSEVRFLFQQAMLEAGFDQRQRSFFKRITNGVLLKAQLDIGAKSTFASIPIHTAYVDEEGGTQYPFLISEVIPGVSYYDLGDDLAHIRYGLRARALLFSEFAKSF